MLLVFGVAARWMVVGSALASVAAPDPADRCVCGDRFGTGGADDAAEWSREPPESEPSSLGVPAAAAAPDNGAGLARPAEGGRGAREAAAVAAAGKTRRRSSEHCEDLRKISCALQTEDNFGFILG